MTPLDLTYLRSLLGHDEILVERFIGIFRSQTPELIAQIQQGLETQDWENASIAAHSLKTQCKYFGLEDLAALAEQVEMGPETPGTEGIFRELEVGLKGVLNALD